MCHLTHGHAVVGMKRAQHHPGGLAGEGAAALRQAPAARNYAKAGIRSVRLRMVSSVAETSYASCGDLSLAYQVFGEGPVELVVAGSFVSHVELFWTMPEFEAWMEQLATFCRVVLFDKAGVGLSDPVPRVPTLDDRATEIEAVMDAVGFGKAAIFGMSEGGPAAIVFAAKRPERTRALILAGTFSFTGTGSDDLECDPAELRERLVPEMGEEYTPSTEQLPLAGTRPRRGLGVGQRCGAQVSAAVGAVDTPARHFGTDVCEPGDGARDTRIGDAAGRSADFADDHGANSGHPCPRGPHSGAVRPVYRRPHPWRADARGRRHGPRALVQ